MWKLTADNNNGDGADVDENINSCYIQVSQLDTMPWPWNS